MRKILCAAVCLLAAFRSYAEERSFASPDGRIKVVVNDNDGKPNYSVSYDGNVFILPSPLGLDTSLGEYVSDMTMLPEKDAPALIHERYNVKTIKQSEVDYKATEAVFTLALRLFSARLPVSDSRLPIPLSFVRR